MKADAEKTPRLSAAEVAALVDTHFPQVNAGGKLIFIDEIADRRAVVRMSGSDRIVRPGGTVSGPAMVALADVAVYAAILGQLGEDAMQAVTTNLNVNFLVRPEPRDVMAHVRLIKIGRRLVVAEVELYSDGIEEMVAHVTATYALPPKA